MKNKIYFSYIMPPKRPEINYDLLTSPKSVRKEINYDEIEAAEAKKKKKAKRPVKNYDEINYDEMEAAEAKKKKKIPERNIDLEIAGETIKREQVKNFLKKAIEKKKAAKARKEDIKRREINYDELEAAEEAKKKAMKPKRPVKNYDEINYDELEAAEEAKKKKTKKPVKEINYDEIEAAEEAKKKENIKEAKKILNGPAIAPPIQGKNYYWNKNTNALYEVGPLSKIGKMVGYRTPEDTIVDSLEEYNKRKEERGPMMVKTIPVGKRKAITMTGKELKETVKKDTNISENSKKRMLPTYDDEALYKVYKTGRNVNIAKVPSSWENEMNRLEGNLEQSIREALSDADPELLKKIKYLFGK